MEYGSLQNRKNCLPSLICHDIPSVKRVNRNEWIKNSPVSGKHSHPAGEKHLSLERTHVQAEFKQAVLKFHPGISIYSASTLCASSGTRLIGYSYFEVHHGQAEAVSLPDDAREVLQVRGQERSVSRRQAPGTGLLVTLIICPADATHVPGERGVQCHQVQLRRSKVICVNMYLFIVIISASNSYPWH